MNKRLKIILSISLCMIFVIAMLIILYLVLSKNITQTSISNYDYVYKANYGHACCERNNGWDSIFGPYYTDDPRYKEYKCNYFAPDCEIELTPTCRNAAAIAVSWYTCDLNGQNCGSNQIDAHAWNSKLIGCDDDDIESFTIPYGKEIKIAQGSGYIRIAVKAKTYYVQGEENGRIFYPSSSGCTLNPSAKNMILDDGLNQLTYFPPNKCVSYFTDLIQTATETYTYGNQDVICQARVLYAIDEIEMKDGKTVKVQGEVVPNAQMECCPAEPNCGLDFKFKEDNIKECNYNYQCPNAGQPTAIDSIHYVEWTCENSGCPSGYDKCCLESDPILVECTTNTECITKHGAGWACDLSPGNFGKCKKSDVPNFCGNDICESLNNENCLTCPTDCKFESDGVTKCVDCKVTPDDPRCEVKCKPWIKIGNTTILPNIWCLLNNFFFKFRLVSSIIIGLLGGLLGALYSKKFIDKQKLKKNWWILLTIGIIFGVAIGYLAFVYFWTAVIILIVLGIVKAIIPGI